MGAFIGIIVVLALVAIPVGISVARTSARKASNATVRRSLDLTSTRSPGERGQPVAGPSVPARGPLGVGPSGEASPGGKRPDGG
jgi:hypothetical protein